MRTLLLALAATPALAQDLPPLDGEAIRAALTDATVDYAGAWQRFEASGRTVHHTRGPSEGRWEVRGDRYCSQWPPASGWACYAVLGEGDRVVFVGESGDETPGTIRR